MAKSNVSEFHRPADETAALSLLSRKSPAAAPAWIGPRVPDKLHDGVEAAIDLARLGLSYVREEAGQIRVGAMTPLQELADSDVLRSFAGGIVAEAARLSAGSALRQAATVGSALSHGSADGQAGRGGPPELALVLLALDAALVTAQAGGSRVTTPFDAGTDSSPKGSFLAEVNFARADEGEMGALMRIARTPRDQAIMAAVAVVDARDGLVTRLRLAVSGASERPMRLPAVEQAMAGQALTPDRLSGIEAQVAALVDPHADYLGSIAYRREMAGLLSRRAIEGAIRRAASRR
jgi:carbon-monoxide dehydrogenase medium subunit